MPRGQGVKISKCCKYFVCECGYTSSNKTGIRLHEKAAHGTNINPKDLDRKDIDGYTCMICKKIFGTEHQLQTHGKHSDHVTGYNH